VLCPVCLAPASPRTITPCGGAAVHSLPPHIAEAAAASVTHNRKLVCVYFAVCLSAYACRQTSRQHNRARPCTANTKHTCKIRVCRTPCRTTETRSPRPPNPDHTHTPHTRATVCLSVLPNKVVWCGMCAEKCIRCQLSGEQFSGAFDTLHSTSSGYTLSHKHAGIDFLLMLPLLPLLPLVLPLLRCICQ
jgi:hypothetical protein